MIPPQPATELAVQHLVLVAQHEQLHVLGQVRADQHRQQAEQAPHQPVEQRQHHPEMVPATLPIPQQNPSSHHEIEFPSGTPSTRPTTTDAALIAAASSAHPGQTTLPPTSPRRESSVGLSSAASSANTSEPPKRAGQARWPNSRAPQDERDCGHQDRERTAADAGTGNWNLVAGSGRSSRLKSIPDPSAEGM